MVERYNKFPHIQLKFERAGIAASPPGGGTPNAITSANASNRQGHGSKLDLLQKSLIRAIVR